MRFNGASRRGYESATTANAIATIIDHHRSSPPDAQGHKAKTANTTANTIPNERSEAPVTLRRETTGSLIDIRLRPISHRHTFVMPSARIYLRIAICTCFSPLCTNYPLQNFTSVLLPKTATEPRSLVAYDPDHCPRHCIPSLAPKSATKQWQFRGRCQASERNQLLRIIRVANEV
jgi:hypothetical protein